MNGLPVDRLILTCERITTNFNQLLEEWEKLQKFVNLPNTEAMPEAEAELEKNKVVTKTETLSQLKALTTRLHCTLPAILRDGLTAEAKAAALQNDLYAAQKKTAALASQCQQWKNKFAAASSECQKEKQAVLELKTEASQLLDQLNQQSEFSSSLGAATATLLWRVSRNQDTIAALLGGSKVEEFLGLTCSTIHSFIDAYRSEWPQEETNESGFILALCGSVTNIAASAYGRDFLMKSENGQRLLDAFVSFVSQAPLKKSAKIKSLMLMGLYNVSINQKGVQYLMAKPGILSLLAWHLTEETDVENRINTLRLLQSLIAECDSSTPSALLQAVPRDLLKTLTHDRSKQVRELSSELLMDLSAITTEKQ